MFNFTASASTTQIYRDRWQAITPRRALGGHQTEALITYKTVISAIIEAFIPVPNYRPCFIFYESHNISSAIHSFPPYWSWGYQSFLPVALLVRNNIEILVL